MVDAWKGDCNCCRLCVYIDSTAMATKLRTELWLYQPALTVLLGPKSQRSRSQNHKILIHMVCRCRFLRIFHVSFLHISYTFIYICKVMILDDACLSGNSESWLLKLMTVVTSISFDVL